MKSLYLSIIVIAVLVFSGTSFVSANATTYGGHLGPMSSNMLFMKSNSNATIKVNYVINSPHNKTIGTEIGLYNGRPENPSPVTSNDLTIKVEPISINLTRNNTVTYTITVKNNIKGVYGIQLFSPCGEFPLVIGLNESDILPSTLFRFSMPVHCGVISSDVPTREIVNYSGIVLKNVIRTQNQFSPLEQAQLGSNSTDVQCKQGLDLIIKTHDNMPACVKPDTATKLVEHGWATQMPGISFGGPTYVINDTDVSQVGNSVSALNLHMSTDSNVIKPGQSIGISISVNNTLGTPVDVTSQNNWSYPNVSTGPCFTIGYGVAILDGFYDTNNMTGGKILNSFNPGLLCPVVQETAKVYEFSPQSSNVKASQCKSIEGLQCRTDTYQMGQNYKFDGYWDAGMVQPFKSGVYTIVGADEWGHVAVEHFVVTNSTIFAGNLGHMSCPVMYGGGQFDAAIKNSTGFAHYYNSEQYGNTFFLHPGTQGVIHVKYDAPENSSWFENNGNMPYNMTNGAALFYMANATVGKSTISYTVSLYSDEIRNHSQICHYGIQYGGGFAEPCNADNTGNIPPSELSVASKLLHPGVSTSFEPYSVMLYPGSSPEYTATISANSDAMTGIYFISLERSLCGPGVLAKLVVMP